MNILLNLILAFYPSVFIWKAIPLKYLLNLNTLASSGMMYFVVHLVAFGAIFFIIYIGLKKILGRQYASSSRGGILKIVLTSFFAISLGIIAFYTVLPGTSLYHPPALVTKYLLSEPYTLIALVLPFIYLFFE